MFINRLWIRGLLLSAVLIQNACVSLTPVSDRIDSANRLANSADFTKSTIPTNQFDLVVYHRPLIRSSELMIVYIEGDGSAWKNGYTPSDNPTPQNPLALKLATQDKRPAVVYLARPCQFVQMPSKGCMPAIWTSARFSQSVIDSTNQAIDVLKQQYQAKELILIGYSGGGAVASLVTAKRTDVKTLVTVAGNLDIEAWIKTYNLEPLTSSLNPADQAKQLSNVAQIHLIGGKDQVIPKSVTQSYLNKLTVSNKAQLIEIQNYGHVCCWEQDWTSILQRLSTANP